MKYTKENAVIHDLLMNKGLKLDEKYIIFNFLLLIYDLRKAFLADQRLIDDNKIFLKKLLDSLDGSIRVKNDIFFYNVKNKNTKILQDVFKNNDHIKTGKALGYYCYKHKKWGDHFNSDRYSFKVKGYFNNDPYDIHLYNFVCSSKETTLKKLQEYGNRLINKYNLVINQYFSSQFKDLKFTFFYEIDFLKSSMYYLKKIKKKDQKFINKNIEMYNRMFRLVTVP